jgi:hypothetical protein
MLPTLPIDALAVLLASSNICFDALFGLWINYVMCARWQEQVAC